MQIGFHHLRRVVFVWLRPCGPGGCGGGGKKRTGEGGGCARPADGFGIFAAPHRITVALLRSASLVLRWRRRGRNCCLFVVDTDWEILRALSLSAEVEYKNAGLELWYPRTEHAETILVGFQ